VIQTDRGDNAQLRIDHVGRIEPSTQPCLNQGAIHLLASDSCPMQMIRYKSNVYATQFHPEADGHSFATRIRIYKSKGYFPPEEAAALTEMVHAADVTVPAEILRRFVARYRAG
jgi:GMP synthase (glutamine-hydrolysing)